MFKINDVVFFEGFGICNIVDIEERYYQDKLNQYYVLSPLSDSASLHTNISVSVDTSRVLRKIADKAGIEKMVHKLATLHQEWDTSSRKRETFYKECIDSGELWNFAKVINYIYDEKNHYRETGRPFPSKDLIYFRKAEQFFNQEIAYVLNIPQDKVNDYIRKTMADKS